MVNSPEMFEGIMTKMEVWKNDLESKGGLKVNMGKTKVMVMGRDLNTVQTSGRYHCAVKMLGRTQSSVVDVRFSFTKSVLIS